MTQSDVNYYNVNAELFIQNTLNVDMEKLHQRFIDNLPKHSKILDAGCGSGRDTLAFMKMGFSVDAFDASIKMVESAKKLTGLPVKHNRFDQIQVVNEYHGIWSCASLLHIKRAELPSSMQVLANTLKDTGIWFISFKYGSEEREKDGRFFTDLTEELLTDLVSEVKDIQIESMWTSVDQRPDRCEKWLNALLRKTTIKL